MKAKRSSNRITKSIIRLCAKARACEAGLAWAERMASGGKVLTVAKLRQHKLQWARWLAKSVPGLPMDIRDELERLGCGRSYWLGGKLHREDGPAIYAVYGDVVPIVYQMQWFLNGQLFNSQSAGDPATVSCTVGSTEFHLSFCTSPGKFHHTTNICCRDFCYYYPRAASEWMKALSSATALAFTARAD